VIPVICDEFRLVPGRHFKRAGCVISYVGYYLIIQWGVDDLTESLRLVIYITAKLEAALQPHIASPHVHIGFSTVLYMRI
jgi:hypothetical protein